MVKKPSIDLILQESVIAAGLLLISFSAFANPTGGTVVQGNAAIGQAPGYTQITQGSQKAIIDWQGFNIGQGEWTNFSQPSSTSITLNRVTTANNPSQILGTMTANGQIFIVNPSGIVFGKNSKVDVAGLVASTANISNSDFMAGIYRFSQAPGTSPAILNYGDIKVKDRGLLALVAPGVENNGTIRANLGRVLLASGTEYTIDLTGDQMITFAPGAKVTQQIVAPDGRVLKDAVANHGTIIADGGKVLLTARAAEAVVTNVINMDGVIQARTVSNRRGQVVLAGGSEGVVRNAGVIDVQGLMDFSQGSSKYYVRQSRWKPKHKKSAAPDYSGGTVQITGQKIGLEQGSNINASGLTGGGTVLVGGDWQGSGTIPHAQKVYMDPKAIIQADATMKGNGGKVVLWSDVTNPEGFTAAFGNISAKGGWLGGNGGNVETSGHNLATSGLVDGTFRSITVNTSAPSGKTGNWLLDPTDITISNAASSGGSFSSGNWQNNPVNNANINVTDLLTALSTNNVLVTTTSAGGGNGSITVVDPIIAPSNNVNSLTLFAGGSQGIAINANIALFGGDLNLTVTNPFAPINFNDAQVDGITLNISARNINIHAPFSNSLAGINFLSGFLTGATINLTAQNNIILDSPFIGVIGAFSNSPNTVNLVSTNPGPASSGAINVLGTTTSSLGPNFLNFFGNVNIGSATQSGTIGSITSPAIPFDTLTFNGTAGQTINVINTPGTIADPTINASHITINLPMNLGANTVITTNPGTNPPATNPFITLGPTASVTGNNYRLTLNSVEGTASNVITLGAPVFGVNNLDVNTGFNGNIIINGSVISINDINLNGPVTSGANLVLQAGNNISMTQGATAAGSISMYATNGLTIGLGVSSLTGGVGLQASRINVGQGMDSNTGIAIQADDLAIGQDVITNGNISIYVSHTATLNGPTVAGGNVNMLANILSLNGVTTNGGSQNYNVGSYLALNNASYTTNGGNFTVSSFSPSIVLSSGGTINTYAGATPAGSIIFNPGMLTASQSLSLTANNIVLNNATGFYGLFINAGRPTGITTFTGNTYTTVGADPVFGGLHIGGQQLILAPVQGGTTLLSAANNSIDLSVSSIIGNNSLTFVGDVILGSDLTIDVGAGNLIFSNNIQGIGRQLTLAANQIYLPGIVGSTGNLASFSVFTNLISINNFIHANTITGNSTITNINSPNASINQGILLTRKDGLGTVNVATSPIPYQDNLNIIYPMNFAAIGPGSVIVPSFNIFAPISLQGNWAILQGGFSNNFPVTITGATTLTSPDFIVINSPINGNQTLTLNSRLGTFLNAPLGNTVPLAGFLSNSLGNTYLGASINSTGIIGFSSPVITTANSSLNASSDIFFGNTLSGIGGLNLLSDGNIYFNNAVNLPAINITFANNVIASSSVITGTFTQLGGSGETRLPYLAANNVYINTNSLNTNVQADTAFLGGAQNLRANVIVRQLMLGGQNGGIVNGIVNGQTGVLASILTTLAPDAEGQFIVNGCLAPNGCITSFVNQTFPQYYMRHADKSPGMLAADIPVCTYAAATGDPDAVARCLAIELHPDSLLHQLLGSDFVPAYTAPPRIASK